MGKTLPLRDKTRGCLLGAYIGDALGAPWECRKAPEIYELSNGRVDEYRSAGPTHRFLPNWPAGKGTDDSIFTDAMVRAFISADGKFDMDTIARQHILAFNRSSAGCGQGTKEAIERLQAGTHWSASASVAPKVGKGNGIAMKIAPYGIYCAARYPNSLEPLPLKGMAVHYRRSIQDEFGMLSRMTHGTDVALGSGAAQLAGIWYCLISNPNTFHGKSFSALAHDNAMVMASSMTPTSAQKDLLSRLTYLHTVSSHSTYSPEEIVRYCGNGGFQAQDSIPFSQAYFLRSPHSIDCMYDVIRAGGDTDTNASMVGALLGALHGPGIFPEHLVNGLADRQEFMDRVERFCDALEMS